MNAYLGYLLDLHLDPILLLILFLFFVVLGRSCNHPFVFILFLVFFWSAPGSKRHPWNYKSGPTTISSPANSSICYDLCWNLKCYECCKCYVCFSLLL